MEPVSLTLAVVTAPAALIHSVDRAKDHIGYAFHDRKLWGDIVDQVYTLVEECKSEEADADEHVVRNILKDLEALRETAIAARKRRPVKALLTATAEHAELEKAKRDLRDLAERVSRVCKGEGSSSFYNGNAEAPLCRAGLDRSARVLEFLKESLTSGQTHRVICICGQPGIGKTTLLNKIWEEVSSKQPFGARACVQIDKDPKLTEVQSQIVSLLNNKPLVTFSSVEFGREVLKNNFLRLKAAKKPVFLAINDIWKAAHLEKLLPLKMTGEIMPKSSCIAVTCRDHRVVEALLRICHLSEDNKSQVCNFKTDCLSLEESKTLVAECSNIQHSDPQHQEMLNDMVPLCGGLPLALTALGKILYNPENRRSEALQQIKKQWATFDDKDNQGTLPVIEALSLSYDDLAPSRKAALLDVIHNFNGWRWDVVESIVDKEVMADLRKSSLISRVDGVNQCNQSALSDGWHDSEYPLSGMENPVSGFVSVHDLTLRFGESIIEGRYVECGLIELQNVLQSDTQVRNLVLKVRCDDGQFAQELLPYLDGKFAELQTLIVVDNGYRPTTIKYRSVAGVWTQHQPLRVLHLYGSGWSSMLEKAALEIRDLRLTSCNDIFGLLDISLPKLHRLEISGCQSLRRFSASCVKAWESLEHFVLNSCPGVMCIPAELGDLPSLRTVSISDCASLEQFPSLRKLPKLHRLDISGYQSPRGFSVKVWGTLEHFVLRSCPYVTRIPAELGDLPSLKTVSISDCASLKHFPALRKANALFSLELSRCRNLQTVGSVDCALQKLVLHVNTDLVLPAGFLQNSSSLLFLSLKGVHLLKVPQQNQALTPSEYLTTLDNFSSYLAVLSPHHEGFRQLRVLKLYQFDLTKLETLGGLDRLEVLVLQGWNKLEMLPEDSENLRSLQELTLKKCESLTKLPTSLCSISSLQILDLEKCCNLIELPGNLGNLRCLTRLCLKGCKSLNKLPHSLCSILSLEDLDLSECSNLSKLPVDLGRLSFLRHLNLSGCRRLLELPKSLCSLRSLKALYMEKCCSLKELPEDIGNLKSLLNLQLGGSRRFKKVPESLCRLESLEILHVKECDSLCELPENIGNLYSLCKLSLKGCKSLKKLPESISRIECLTYLDLDECDNLCDLPENIGNLSSLCTLSLKGCNSLRKLPESLSRIERLTCRYRRL